MKSTMLLLAAAVFLQGLVSAQGNFCAELARFRTTFPGNASSGAGLAPEAGEEAKRRMVVARAELSARLARVRPFLAQGAADLRNSANSTEGLLALAAGAAPKFGLLVKTAAAAVPGGRPLVEEQDLFMSRASLEQKVQANVAASGHDAAFVVQHIGDVLRSRIAVDAPEDMLTVLGRLNGLLRDSAGQWSALSVSNGFTALPGSAGDYPAATVTLHLQSGAGSILAEVELAIAGLTDTRPRCTEALGGQLASTSSAAGRPGGAMGVPPDGDTTLASLLALETALGKRQRKNLRAAQPAKADEAGEGPAFYYRDGLWYKSRGADDRTRPEGPGGRTSVLRSDGSWAPLPEQVSRAVPAGAVLQTLGPVTLAEADWHPRCRDLRVICFVDAECCSGRCDDGLDRCEPHI